MAGAISTTQKNKKPYDMEASLNHSLIAAGTSLCIYGAIAAFSRRIGLPTRRRIALLSPIVFALVGPVIPLIVVALINIKLSDLGIPSASSIVAFAVASVLIIGMSWVIGGATTFTAGVLFSLACLTILPRPTRSLRYVGFGLLVGAATGILSTWVIWWSKSLPKISDLWSVDMLFSGAVPGLICALVSLLMVKILANQNSQL